MSIIETLQANGYVAEFDRESRPQIVGATHGWYYPSSAAFHADERMPMRDATASVCVLEFTADEALPAKFTRELLALLAPADRLLKKHQRPLVRVTPTSMQFVYQTDTANVELRDHSHPARPQIFKHGLALPDSESLWTAHLRATCGCVLLDGGEWLNQASPLTVKRAELPVFDSDATALKLLALVERFVVAGELRVLGPYVPPTQDYSPEAMLARQGVRIVPPTDDAPPPIQYADERLRAVFGVRIGGTPTGGTATGNGFAARRRG
jgi:hypothetical protein